MLVSTMPSTVAQAMRACGRTLPTAKTLPVVGFNSSSTSRALTRRAFLISPSYKARVAVAVAVRAYATATATATKKAPTTRRTRISPAGAKPKKAAAKKAKAKPKAKKATKKVAKKKAVRAKKVVSPEKKAVLEKRELKKVGLLYGEPKQETATSWTTYVAEHIKGESVSGPTRNFGDVMKRLSAEFKSVSASDKSRLEQKAQENKAINAVNYKKWVESHTVAEIYKANLARNRLTKVYNIKTRKIIDERFPKRPVSAFAHYVKSRSSSFNEGQTVSSVIKSIGSAWKSLSAADKKPFEDLMQADKSRYLKDMQRTGLPTPQLSL